MKYISERIHKLPRIWSNNELKKFAHIFSGNVVNISGWKDSDKEGKKYETYFRNASTYTITNFKNELRGLQGIKNEIFLDLEKDLPSNLKRSFDVAFNHTVLAHIYNFQKAFSNLCEISNDIVILVVPFLQQYMANYGDYWRFTPLSIKKLFEDNGYETIYMSFNSNKFSSVYIFAIASRNPDKWRKFFNWEYSVNDINSNSPEKSIGSLAIPAWIGNPKFFFYNKFIEPMKKLFTTKIHK
tara:strand:- start:1114 stop:1836 length:723 start_codon:yes stop_codon:yes gene_type:complete